MRLTYRPGGGNARLDLAVRDLDTKEAIEAGKNGALVIVGPEGPAFAALPRKSGRLRMTMPLWLVCRLQSARMAMVTLFDDAAGTDGSWPPVPIDIGAPAGAKSALDEAYPPALSSRR